MNFLTDEERKQLKQKHKKERDGRVRDRIKSVILSDHGWTPKKIAEALLISEDAVRNHIQEYKNSKKLKPENGGSTEKLSDEQSESLEKHLETYTYVCQRYRCLCQSYMGDLLYNSWYEKLAKET